MTTSMDDVDKGCTKLPRRVQGRLRTKAEFASAGVSTWDIRHGNDRPVQSARKKRKGKSKMQRASRKRNRG